MHIGFMESEYGNSDEEQMKILHLKDELEERKSAFVDTLVDADGDVPGMDINSSMIGVDDE